MVKKKSGRAMNPADTHRKEQRKKEIKKNKAERTRVRKVALALKDTTKIEAELAELKERARHGRLDKNTLAKKQQLEEKLQKMIEAKTELGIKYEPKSPQKSAGGASSSARERDPTRSVYYHPFLNPLGAPPPGKPWREIDDGTVPRPLSPKGGDRETSSDEDDSGSDSSEEGTDTDEDVKPEGEKEETAPEGSSESTGLTAAQSSALPSAALSPVNLHVPPSLPPGQRPGNRRNLFAELPEHPVIIFDRNAQPRPPLRPPYMPAPPAGCPRPPLSIMLGNMPPPMMLGNMPLPMVQPYPPVGPGGLYQPAVVPHIPPPITRPPSATCAPSFAPHAPPPTAPGQRVPPTYDQRPPPQAAPPGLFPIHGRPPGIATTNPAGPGTFFAAAHAALPAGPAVGPGAAPVQPLPPRPPVASAGPGAGTIIAAAPKIRDFQKEVTSLVPTHLLRKRNAGKSTSVSRPVHTSALPGSIRPSVNAAPDLGDDDDDVVESAPAKPTSLVASIFGNQPKADIPSHEGAASFTQAAAAGGKGVDTAERTKPKPPSTADEYTRFMNEMGDLLADGS